MYSLEGVGADRDPVGLFTVNLENGDIQVTKKLDREEASVYHVSTRFLECTAYM